MFETALKMEIKPRTPLRPAAYPLPIAAAEDAAQYFDKKHRNGGNIQCLYRAMRVFVSLGKEDRKLFLSTFGQRLDAC